MAGTHTPDDGQDPAANITGRRHRIVVGPCPAGRSAVHSGTRPVRCGCPQIVAGPGRTRVDPTGAAVRMRANPTGSAAPMSAIPTAATLPILASPTGAALPIRASPTTAALRIRANPTATTLPIRGDPTTAARTGAEKQAVGAHSRGGEAVGVGRFRALIDGRPRLHDGPPGC